MIISGDLFLCKRHADIRYTAWRNPATIMKIAPGVGEPRRQERLIGDGATLPDELVQPLAGGCAVALAVNVDSARGARWLAVEEDAESHGSSWCFWPHDEMEVAGVEAAGDPPVGRVQRAGLFLRRPVPGQGPVIESQPRGGNIDVALAR
jgi:hypothetical protein